MAFSGNQHTALQVYVLPGRVHSFLAKASRATGRVAGEDDMALLYTKEGTGAIYTATLEDSDETAIPLANISAITLTLYNVADDSIINSREDQDVKNTNQVTIHSTSGLLTWAMQAE